MKIIQIFKNLIKSEVQELKLVNKSDRDIKIFANTLIVKKLLTYMFTS